MGEHSRIDRLESIYNLGTSDLVAKYGQCRNDEERFILALETVLRNSAILFEHGCEQKNSQHSIKSREYGDVSFKSGRYYKAIQEYTESIMYAVDSSEELALAYANRSAVLFGLKKYTECIKDINRALNLKYSDKLKTKLYKREGLCLKMLGKSGADSSFEEALVFLEKMNLSEGEMNKNRGELRKLIAAPCKVLKVSESVQQTPLPEIVTPNLELPCASDAVAIKYSEQFGRHLVATRKIKPGEILVLEKPYCLRLIPKNVYTHCSYCLQVSWDLIACTCCVNVAYCSEACRDTAWDKYHEVECPMLGLLRDFRFNNVFYLSLRTTIMATKKGMNLNALKEELTSVDSNTDPRTKGYGDDGRFHSDQYRSIYSLRNHADKYSTDNLLITALSVASIVCILAMESVMFGKKLELDTLPKNPDVIFVGRLILKHVYAITINVNSFGPCRFNDNYEHGHALMAICSLLNHSCDANVLKQWHVDRLALYASYPIEQGEQIFDCYGPSFSAMKKRERQEALKSWNFNCECRPCIENWPWLLNLSSYKGQPISQQNKSKLDSAMLKFGRNHLPIEMAMKKNSKETLSKLLELIELLFQLAQRPCAELTMAVGILKEYYGSADTVFHHEPVIY